MARLKQVEKQWRELKVELELAQGVSASYTSGLITVTGPLGSNTKRLKYPNVDISVEGNKVSISTKRLTQREKKIIMTYRAHVTNLIKGVTEGFTYKLRVVYAKFPMSVEMSGQKFTVKNLLGMKVPRTMEIPQGVEVKIEGAKEIIVKGIDKELVGQVAASLEQLTRITHLDRRVIQDGIFIIEKPHRRYV